MLAMDSFKKLRDSLIKTLSWALVWRCLAWLSLVLGLLVAAAYLGLRWYVWPQLNELGPRVIALMSEHLPRPIELRQMRGDMVAGRPVLRIEGLSMRDDQGQSLLEIGVVEAELSITPLLWGEIDLNRLRLHDVAMAAKRINPHTLQIAAWDIALDKPHDDRWMQWLLSQSRLEVNNMALRWRDDVLGSEVLVEGIQLEAVNQLREHRWRIDAKRVGGHFTMRVGWRTFIMACSKIHNIGKPGRGVCFSVLKNSISSSSAIGSIRIGSRAYYPWLAIFKSLLGPISHWPEFASCKRVSPGRI